MGAALTHNYSLDLSSTGSARLPLALVHTEVVLEIPPAVYPIDAGSITPDALFQHVADGME